MMFFDHLVIETGSVPLFLDLCYPVPCRPAQVLAFTHIPERRA